VVVFGSTLAVLYLARRALYLRPSILPPLPSRAQPSAQASLVGWSKIGFHRPLAGTLFLLGVGLVIGVPLLLYDATFLRQVLIPEQQVFTFWEQVLRWLRVVWVLLDLGIGVTAVRFFALCRLRDRRQGYRYFQFYIWWQLVSGAVQLGLTLWLSAFFLPFTSLAHLSFYFVARMLLQFPGFLYVFRLLFRAFQRFDYEQLLTAVSLAATVVLQTLMVITLRAWGGVRPGIGAQVGSVLGLGAGQVLSSLLIFLLGSWLYKRAGYSLRWLFLPAFDLSIIARALGFGARLAFGSLAIPAVGWAQSYLLPRLFPDFGRLAGDLTLITLLVVGYELLAVALYDAMIPTLAVAEAQHYGSLKRYYATQGVRYGFWFSAFFLAVLAALGLPFLNSVLGEAVQIAPELFYGLLIWGAFQWLPWSAERSLVAVGRPALRSWLLLGGQLLRLILLWLFVPRLGTWGVPVAYLLALLGRGGTGWIITRRAAVRAPLPGWQGIVAPAGAALLIYNVLQGLVDLAWPLGAQGAVWLVILTLPPTLALYAFFTGLLGGWDEGGIQELAEAMRISSIGVPVGWLMLWGVRFGARISPLHDAFPMKLRTLAAEEAEALTLRYPPA
jgi:O-antigen/teichoic acid export membrane protein